MTDLNPHRDLSRLRPSRPALNRELLVRVLDTIERNPERHDQDMWRSHTCDYDDTCHCEARYDDTRVTQHEPRCKTIMCFAGWAAELAGGCWVNEESSALFAEPHDPSEDVSYSASRGIYVVEAATRARRLLGLTDEEADELFLECDTLEDIRECVHDLLETR